MARHFMLCVLLILSVAVLCGFRPGEEVGQIKHLLGDVQVLWEEQTRVVILGDIVYQGNTILTGPDGSVGITLIDDARIALGPNSRLLIQVFQFDAVAKRGHTKTRLDRGSGIFATGATSMTVETPKTRINVQGTQFGVEVRP